MFGPCIGQTLPAPEACNALDDDCNGVIDNGCAPGCADGTREGFVNAATHPLIAGCSGGWSVPGLIATLAPACNHVAGNTSPNPSGAGCSVADLCAPGFHVCTGPNDVAAHSPSACAGAAPGPGLFFVTRQSSTGCKACALGMSTDPNTCTGCSCAGGCAQTALTANDLFGCGSLGAILDNECGILDRFSNNLCSSLGPPWSCGADGCNEANAVTKGSSAAGGVLCCAD